MKITSIIGLLFLYIIVLFFVNCNKKDSVTVEENKTNGNLSILPISTGYGIWMWYSKEKDCGAANIIGQTTKEDELFSKLGNNYISEIYLSLDEKIAENPDQIENFLKKAHEHRILVYSLYSNNRHILSENQDDLLAILQKEFIDFNNLQSSEDTRFDGLHFDFEPHGLESWKISSSDDKRVLLENMKELYLEIKNLLNNSAMRNKKIAVDLPIWYDNLDTQIKWASNADRDLWFSSISTVVNSVSLMAYEQNNISSILKNTEYERKVFLNSKIALNLEDLGSKFVDLSEFNGLINMILTNKLKIDIHNYCELSSK